MIKLNDDTIELNTIRKTNRKYCYTEDMNIYNILYKIYIRH